MLFLLESLFQSSTFAGRQVINKLIKWHHLYHVYQQAWTAAIATKQKRDRGHQETAGNKALFYGKAYVCFPLNYQENEIEAARQMIPRWVTNPTAENERRVYSAAAGEHLGFGKNWLF